MACEGRVSGEGSAEVRLGIDAGRAVHGHGGVSTYTRELIHALIESPRVDEIVLFDLDHGLARRQTFEKALGPLPDKISAARAERNVLDRLDLFHAPGYAMPPEGAPRHVFTLYDLTVLSHPDCHTLRNRVRTLTSVSDALVRGATILAISEATRQEAARLLTLPPDSVEIIPPMVDQVFQVAGEHESDAAAAARLGVREPYVLAVASLEPRKNFGGLLDAWTSLGASVGAHQLVVVAAEGWRQGKVRRRLDRMTGDGSVVKIGHIPEIVLAALYRRAAAFVFPSLAEGFGLPVAEAMACGTPVVTSRVSSMPEVAGDAALLVDPENPDEIAAAIARLLGSPALRRRLRERGLEQVRLFSREVVVPQLFEVYRRAAQR
jgi:glycosyltransferase involved in cell wall biosynthesis